MAQSQAVSNIRVERPDAQRLKTLNVTTWPIWTKEPSTFDWHYDEAETCYMLEGEVTVTTGQGDLVVRQGDLVTFPKGLDCTWQVTQAVRKHYRFG